MLCPVCNTDCKGVRPSDLLPVVPFALRWECPECTSIVTVKVSDKVPGLIAQPPLPGTKKPKKVRK